MMLPTTMLHRKDGIGQEMSGAWFPPNLMPGIQAKEFNLGFIRLNNLVSHGLRVLWVPFLINSKWAVMCLYLAVASVWPL
jgi:hypothetical protein